MITDGKKWHYLVVKKLPALLRRITSNHKGDFYQLNCFDSYSTEKNIKKHEKVFKNHGYCYVEMPNEDKKILTYNPGEKSIKVLFIIYSDFECLFEKMSLYHNNPDFKGLLEKISLYHNNPEKSSAIKEFMHLHSGYSLFTKFSLDSTKNMLDC